MNKRRYITLYVIVVMFTIISCKKNKTEDAGPVSDADLQTRNFSRQAMLTNLANNLIEPALMDFSNQADTLSYTIINFTDNPTPGKLDTLQNRLDKATLAWEYCGWFRYGSAREQFGPVDGTKKMDEINIFPVSGSKIENYISTGDYTLNNTDYDSRGLGAIDYLINSLEGKDSTILTAFDQSDNRKQYLKSLGQAVKSRARFANANWSIERFGFVSSTGTDAASSTSLVVLDMDVDYENIKNYKVGIPVGRIQLGYTLPSYPDKTESYYGGYSVKYLRANIKAIENLWRGRDKNGTDGIGFDDYLNAAGGEAIVQSTVNQFNAIYAKLDALPPGRLSDLIKGSDKAKVQDLYNELLKLTRYIKSDMVSQLGISISYASGDGD